MTLLVLLAVAGMLIAVAIKIDSHGPVLFVQRRTAVMRPFNFFQVPPELRANHAGRALVGMPAAMLTALTTRATSGPYKPQTNGQEVTRIGRLLRMSVWTSCRSSQHPCAAI